MAALDTNVLVRLLIQDEPAQLRLAQRLVGNSVHAGELLFVPISVALELEWVLRSRFKLDKPAVLQTFAQLLSTVELEFEQSVSVEWALKLYKGAAADFSDCLHAALAHRAGEQPLWTFDKAAAKVAGARLLT